MHQRRTEFPPVGCSSQLFNRLILLALLGIAMAESSPLTAQTTSTLRGAVTDQQHLAIVGATITLSAPTGIDAKCRSVATSRLLVQSQFRLAVIQSLFSEARESAAKEVTSTHGRPKRDQRLYFLFLGPLPIPESQKSKIR